MRIRCISVPSEPPPDPLLGDKNLRFAVCFHTTSSFVKCTIELEWEMPVLCRNVRRNDDSDLVATEEIDDRLVYVAYTNNEGGPTQLRLRSVPSNRLVSLPYSAVSPW